jgi:parallel beta-helix repeat protein
MNINLYKNKFIQNLLLLLFVTNFILVPVAEGNIIKSSNVFYVDDSGGADFTSIQEAINAANDGDTIYVFNGTYKEQIIINKKINLIGEDKNNTIISGDFRNFLISVKADNVLISGFKLEGHKSFFSLSSNIFISSNYVTISDCIIKNAGFGIKLKGMNTKILNNTINNCKSGIFFMLSVRNNLIEQNNISDNYFGIFSFFSFFSSDNIIKNNLFYNNFIGVNLVVLSRCFNIYHNNFIKNNFHCKDSGQNLWNSNYPLGGNYWDDYTGVDNFHGPNQDIPGSDGIIDAPYVFGNIKDEYPFKLRDGWKLNIPPYTPYDPNPKNDAKSVDIDINLSWKSGDFDDDLVFYDIYFGTSSPPPKVKNNWTSTNYNPGSLTHNTTYHWKITAKDTKNQQTTGPIWTFTTKKTNQPPNIPSNPNPANDATNIDPNTDLSWTAGYPDGDTVTYDVYFGISTNPSKISSNQTAATYNPGTMNFETTYYWRIISWGEHDAKTTGPLWSFTTQEEQNNPPNIPSNPNPANQATNVDLDAILSWTGGDPDGNTVTYDVYFGTSNNPPKVTTNQSQTTYNPGTMTQNTTYHWKIKAWDEHEATTTGPTWTFTTKKINQPPNIPNTPTGPTTRNTGQQGTYSTSATDPDNDQVQYRFDWDDGTTSTWTNLVNSGTTASKTKTWNSPGTYRVKAQARDQHGATSEWSTQLQVIINSPNQPPNIPSNPNPADGAVNISLNVTLGWTGSDPDGDIFIYSIFFGKSSTNPDFIKNQTSNIFNPGILEEDTWHYWRIIAKNQKNLTAISPIWSFKTISETMISKPPTAIISGPFIGYSGVKVFFDGSNSHDNDEGKKSIIRYDWKFFENDTWHENLGANPGYTYDSIGEYQVSLRVTDNENDQDTTTITIKIQEKNDPPSKPTITGNPEAKLNEDYTILVESYDPDGDPIRFLIDWGDLSIYQSDYSEENLYIASYKYTKKGIYIVTFQADDGKLKSDKNSITVFVEVDVLEIDDKIKGYFVDTNKDNYFDYFFNMRTKKDNKIERHSHFYWIDSTDDGKWNYIYDSKEKTVYEWTEEVANTTLVSESSSGEGFLDGIAKMIGESNLKFLPIILIGAIIIIAETMFVTFIRKKGFFKN